MQEQVSSAHNVWCEDNTKLAVRLMTNVTASKAHDHNFCPEMMLFLSNSNLRRQTEMEEDKKADLERSEKAFAHLLCRRPSSVYTKNCGLYNCDPSH